MKAEDITIYETGNHCYGDILRVNGKDFEDYDKSELIEFINDMMMNDINSDNIIKEMMKISLEYLQFEEVDSRSEHCDQCGNYNLYEKFKR